MIRRSGAPITSTANRLARAPPRKNRARNRHGPITRSAGRPKISRNTRLPSRCAQSACRNRALTRRSHCCGSAHDCHRPAPGTPPASAPHSSNSVRCRASGRDSAQTNAAHSSAASSGVAQRSEAPERMGTDTNMGPTYPFRRVRRRARKPSRARGHIHHTQQYGIVPPRRVPEGRAGSGGETGRRVRPHPAAAHPRYRRETAMRTIPHVTVLALGIAGALAFASSAHAAGFQLKENSVKGQGMSFAGTAAKTGDSSVVTNNPAVMTQFEGNTFQADVTAIDLTYEFRGTATDAFGQPMTGGDGGNAGAVTPVPAMSYIRKLDNGVALGAMISAPFGLKTEYDDNWVGRYFAHTSDVQIVDLTLSGALDITDRFSVGIGAIVSRADVTLSKSVDFGTLLYSNPQTRPLPFARPQMADGFVEVQGDDNGLGWVVGAHWRPTDALSFGASYRSEIDYELAGTAEWTVPGEVQAVLGANPMTAPLFQTGPG